MTTERKFKTGDLVRHASGYEGTFSHYDVDFPELVWVLVGRHEPVWGDESSFTLLPQEPQEPQEHLKARIAELEASVAHWKEAYNSAIFAGEQMKRELEAVKQNMNRVRKFKEGDRVQNINGRTGTFHQYNSYTYGVVWYLCDDDGEFWYDSEDNLTLLPQETLEGQAT